MIRVNLAPSREKRKFKPTRAPVMPSAPSTRPTLLSILIILIVYAGIFWFYHNMRQRVIADRSEFEKLNNEVEDFKKKVKIVQTKYEEIKRIIDITNNQLEILRALDPPDRILWSEKLNMLAELIPDGVYLTQIRLTESVTEVATKESEQKYKEWEKAGKKGTPPKLVKKPIIRQTLYLSGVSRAETPEKRLRLISAFSEALKNFSWTTSDGRVRKFYEDFTGEIDTSEIVNITLEGVPVTKFTFILQTKPFST